MTSFYTVDADVNKNIGTCRESRTVSILGMQTKVEDVSFNDRTVPHE